MIVGCYTIDLYCANNVARAEGSNTEHPHMAHLLKINGRNEAQAKAACRAKGWKFIRDSNRYPDVLCPQCAKKVNNK